MPSRTWWRAAWRGGAALALLLTSSLPAGTAAQVPTQGPPPVPAYAVAVASDASAQRVLPALQQAGTQALQSTAPFVVVGPSASPGPGPSSGQDQALLQQSASVNSALQAGLQAMSNLELDTAAAQFEQVVSAFEDTPALIMVTTSQPFAQALINLGINAFLSGDEGATEERFRFAVSIDPTVMPDAELFPDVLAIYNRVVDDLGSRALARVEVQTEPDGAEVWIDGVQKGNAPLDEEVTPGKHVFTARADGYETGGVIEEVRGGRRAARVTIRLEQGAGGGSTAAGSQQPRGVSDLPAALMEGSGREVTLYRSIADQVAARVLLVLWLMPGGETTSMVSIQVYDRQADRVIGTGLSPEVPLDSSSIGAAVSGSIRQVLSEPAQQLMAAWTPPPPPPSWDAGTALEEDAGDDDGSIAEEWWFWTIIGALVAGGAATGIYFGVTAGEGPNGPDNPQLILEF